MIAGIKIRLRSGRSLSALAVGGLVAVSGCMKDPATLDTPVKVYETYCFACHNSGAAGAPRLNDKQRWQNLLAAGEDRLIENTLKGIRAMPPRGSCAGCTDEQLAETVRWMLSQNGLR